MLARERDIGDVDKVKIGLWGMWSLWEVEGAEWGGEPRFPIGRLASLLAREGIIGGGDGVVL